MSIHNKAYLEGKLVRVMLPFRNHVLSKGVSLDNVVFELDRRDWKRWKKACIFECCGIRIRYVKNGYKRSTQMDS